MRRSKDDGLEVTDMRLWHLEQKFVPIDRARLTAALTLLPDLAS